MSKFLTIDLYIVHTASAYAPVAIQETTKIRMRFDTMSAGFAGLKARPAVSQGSIISIITVNGLKLDRASMNVLSEPRPELRKEYPHQPSAPQAPSMMPTLLITARTVVRQR